MAANLVNVTLDTERDQQKWNPVCVRSRSKNFEIAHDLIAKPLTLWRIMR